MPAAASAVEAQREPWSPDAIRERIALVVETFTRATARFPEPMTEEDAAALALAMTEEDAAALALAITDAEIEALDAPLAFAVRWGVSRLDSRGRREVTVFLRAPRLGTRLSDKWRGPCARLAIEFFVDLLSS